MEEQNTKSSGHINNTGISNGQKWILALSCLFLLLPIVVITIDCGSFIDDWLYPTSLFLLYPAIGAYYTILIYIGTYTKSKYNWIPLAIGIICVIIQGSFVSYSSDEYGKLIFSQQTKAFVFFIETAIIYIISAVCLYKWETISKIETRWIPFTIILLTLFASNIFYLYITRESRLPKTKKEKIEELDRMMEEDKKRIEEIDRMWENQQENNSSSQSQQSEDVNTGTQQQQSLDPSVDYE